MTNDCACGRPIQDTAVICAHCGYTLDAALADLLDEPLQLAAELDITMSRQTVMGARHASRTTTIPAPSHAAAAEAATTLHAVLAGWARVIITGTGAEPPADTITAIAVWLRPRVGWLRHHEAGGDARDEIVAAVRDVRRVVDRPVERLYAGPCDVCGGYLYARPGAAYVACRSIDCDEVYSVEQRRAWMRSQLENLLGSSTYVAMVCTGLGVKISESTIRMWVQRHKLRPHHYVPPRKENGKPRPLYRVGDVIRVAAGEDIYTA